MKSFDELYNEALKYKTELYSIYKPRKDLGVASFMALMIIGTIIFIIVWFKHGAKADEAQGYLIYGVVMFTCLPVYLFIYSKIERRRHKIPKEYKDLYIEKVINPFLHNVDETFYYKTEKDATLSEEIKTACIAPSVRIFYEDVIEGRINDSKILFFKYLYWVKENNGDSSSTMMVPANVVCGTTKIDDSFELAIVPETKKEMFLKNNRYRDIERVELDDPGFEEYFQVYSNDKILAHRILTADVMRKIVEDDRSCEIDIRNGILLIESRNVLFDFNKRLEDKEALREAYNNFVDGYKEIKDKIAYVDNIE